MQDKAEHILTAISSIPQTKLLHNQLVNEINSRLPKLYKLKSKTIAFMVSVLAKRKEIILNKEIICCHTYYTITLNRTGACEHEEMGIFR